MSELFINSGGSFYKNSSITFLVKDLLIIYMHDLYRIMQNTLSVFRTSYLGN